MRFEDILHGHISSGVAMTLMIIVLAFFIFMSVKMFKKSKDKSVSNKKQAKNYGTLFAIAAIVIVLIMVGSVFLHYHISIKDS